MADRMHAYPDGTELTLIGQDVQGDGIVWRHVRASDGSEGYLPSTYASSQRTAPPVAGAARTPNPATATPQRAAVAATQVPTQPLVVTGGGSGCGSRGGPGYRLNNGKCASWEDARRGRH